MSETVQGGTLGAVAVAELQQVAAARERLAQQQAALAQQETRVLALVAEAQGCPVEAGRTRFDYDLGADPPTWRLAAVEVVATPAAGAEPDGG